MEKPVQKEIYLFLDDMREPTHVYSGWEDVTPTWEVFRTTGKIWNRIVDLVYPVNANTGDLLDDPYSGKVFLSLDHDLGTNEPTGYDLVKLLEAAMYNDPRFKRLDLTIKIHSANPVGRENMERGITAIAKFKAGL